VILHERKPVRKRVVANILAQYIVASILCPAWQARFIGVCLLVSYDYNFFFESTLEDMTNTMMLAVEILPVGTIEKFHATGQSGRTGFN
jgi:hypothetical protein